MGRQYSETWRIPKRINIIHIEQKGRGNRSGRRKREKAGRMKDKNKKRAVGGGG